MTIVLSLWQAPWPTVPSRRKSLGVSYSSRGGPKWLRRPASRSIKLNNHMSSAQRRKGGGKRGRAELYIRRNCSVTCFLQQDSTTFSNNASWDHVFRCLCLGWRARNTGTEAVLKRSLQGWENAGKEVSEKETSQDKEPPGPRLQLTLHL